MSNKSIRLTDDLYEYLLSISLRESDILSKIREYTSRLEQAYYQISPEQGQFMSLLTKIHRANKCLELGVFTGYSSLCISMALPIDGVLVACDVNNEYLQIAKIFWDEAKVSDKIIPMNCLAIDLLNNLISEGEEGTFDLIFIDADKTNYPIYYDKSIRLLKVGGLLLIDNVLFGGKVLSNHSHDSDTNGIQLLNNKVYNDYRIELSILPIGDGLSIVRKVI